MPKPTIEGLTGEVLVALAEIKQLEDKNTILAEKIQREEGFKFHEVREERDRLRQQVLILTHLLRAMHLGADPKDGLTDLAESM